MAVEHIVAQGLQTGHHCFIHNKTNNRFSSRMTVNWRDDQYLYLRPDSAGAVTHRYDLRTNRLYLWVNDGWDFVNSELTRYANAHGACEDDEIDLEEDYY